MKDLSDLRVAFPACIAFAHSISHLLCCWLQKPHLCENTKINSPCSYKLLFKKLLRFSKCLNYDIQISKQIDESVVHVFKTETHKQNVQN